MRFMRLTIFGILLLTGVACTSVKGTLTRACDVTRLSLSTGYDHAGGHLLNPGASDNKWIVIRDPDNVTVEPRPATVTNPYVSWANSGPDSQWIGPHPNGTTDPQDPARAGTYSYLYCFCLCDRAYIEAATLKGELRADNEATVYLNDVVILPTTANNTYSSKAPVPFEANSDLIRRGLNCLRVDVVNGEGPTGLNVSGTITKTTCCQGRTSRPQPGPGVGDPLNQPSR